MRAARLLTVVGILGTGVCAAWPFRQPEPRWTEPPVPARPLALALRGPDVVLPADDLDAASPARDLGTVPASYAVHSQAAEVGQEQIIDLENLAPPPPLPIDFGRATGEPASDFAHRAAAPPAKSKPRSYRLRDGDTLERLAERFLGSAERAAEIYEANRDQLARPDLLPVGTTLQIPLQEG